MVSAHDESVYAEVAFRAGALGYLMKEEALGKVITAIRRVLGGGIYVSDALDYQQSGLISRFSESGTPIGTFRAGIIPGRFCFK